MKKTDAWVTLKVWESCKIGMGKGALSIFTLRGNEKWEDKIKGRVRWMTEEEIQREKKAKAKSRSGRRRRVKERRRRTGDYYANPILNIRLGDTPPSSEGDETSSGDEEMREEKENELQTTE